MFRNAAFCILVPFIGTSLGAAAVFFVRQRMPHRFPSVLSGFAAGIMTAASFWSLLAPAIDSCAAMGRLAFIPVAAGFLLGAGFILLLGEITPHLHTKVRIGPTAKLVLAVTLHNIPEGMAVGIVCAAWLVGGSIGAAGVLALSIGIAIQNLPEGAIVSLPLLSEGMPKRKAFLYGVVSGAVEPIAAVLTILAAGAVEPVMPYFLAFAAGAMIYVVAEELVPQAAAKNSAAGPLSFSLGFTLMMILDVALG